MREIEISLSALRQGDDEYIMHLRNGDKQRGAVGLIGFFGGSKEPGENDLQVARRELRQETNLHLPEADFEQIGEVEVESDRDNEPVWIKASVFLVEIPDGTKVIAKEKRDKIVIASVQDILHNYIGQHKLTPATEAAFNGIILKRNHNGTINH